MVSRQTDKNKTVTRVYKYGLVPLGYPPEETITELWRANKLWNTLVNIHRKNRDDLEEARCAAHNLYGEISEQLTAINEKIDQAYKNRRSARMNAGTRDPNHPLIMDADALIRELTAERATTYETLKPIRTEADKLVDKKSLDAAFYAAVKKASRKENTNGLYNVTAHEVRKDFTNARERSFKTRGILRHHHFDGTGFYAFRFKDRKASTDGVLFGSLFQGNKPNEQRFSIIGYDDTQKKTKLRLRTTLAGTKQGEKIFQLFDLIYHRPIPDGSKIPNGKIVRTRVGDKFKYHVVLTVKSPITPAKSVPKDTAIGIDIGFRNSGSSIQVATIWFDDPNIPPREIMAPDKMITGMERVITLQSILDESAAELGKRTKPNLQAHPLSKDHKRFRLWSAMANYPNNVTLSYETAYKVARWLQQDPDFIPEQSSKEVLKWWAAYSRRYRELHNLRAKQLRHRKHFFRQVAADLVSHKQLIVLENINLSKLASVKDDNNELSNKARAQRFLVSPAEFRNVITNAADREGVPTIKVPPHYTSKTCYDCKFVNKALKAEKEWACPNCGTTHDRDINAARNIAEAGKKLYKKKKM